MNDKMDDIIKTIGNMQEFDIKILHILSLISNEFEKIESKLSDLEKLMKEEK